MATGIPLGRVGGIRLTLDWTVLFVFGLVVTNLALVTFPACAASPCSSSAA